MSATTVACAGGSSARQRPSSRRVSDAASARAGSPSRATRAVLDERLGAALGAQRACATSLHVLTTSRCSQVENCDSPRNWPIRRTSFASDSCAASRASSGSRSRCSASRSTRGACRSHSAASALRVAVLGAASRGSGRRASRRRAARRAAGLGRLDGLRRGGVARRPTLVRRGASTPEIVLPRAPRLVRPEYHYAAEAPTTQRHAPGGRARTARSRSPSTRPRAAAGSAASGSTSPALDAFSVVLYPPPPVARWPELTLVAARAVAGAIGAGRDDQAPERRARRRAEGGGHPRRGGRARRARDRGQRRRDAVARRRLRSSATGSSCSSRSSSGSSAATTLAGWRTLLGQRETPASRGDLLRLRLLRVPRRRGAAAAAPRVLAIHFDAGRQPGHAGLAEPPARPRAERTATPRP